VSFLLKKIIAEIDSIIINRNVKLHIGQKLCFRLFS